MATTSNVACQYCGQNFKRQDHLARHELSHGEAKYYCQVTTCGMAFHRRDVLRRHERVHQSDPTKKRRRPRRGTVPNVKPTVPSNILQPTQQTDFTQAGSTTEVTFLYQRQTSVPVTTPTLSPLDFCFAHYLHMCTKRWPFMHHSSLQQAHMAMEKQLAMAALGGCVVPEYRLAAATFFEEARGSLVVIHGKSAASAVMLQLNSRPYSSNGSMLELVQTHMLLLEYALWQTGTDASENTRAWAIELTFEYAAFILPGLLEHVNSLTQSHYGWTDWLYEEQLIRALWTFYCITQKAMSNFPCSISTLRSQQHLPLPRSDILFHASDEHNWSESRNELATHGIGSNNITLKAALQIIQSSVTAERQVLASLLPMARHIVLVALQDVSANGLKYLTPTTNNQSQAGIYIDMMRSVRSLWHTSLDEPFFSLPPRSMDFQNVLLLNHLQIRALLHHIRNEDYLRHQSSRCEAASIANEVLTPILERGTVNISTPAAWITDSASKRYVVSMAKVMLDWARMLKSIGSQARTFDEDESCHGALYRQIIKALQWQEDANLCDRSVNEVAKFAKDLENAWCDILRCPTVRWYPTLGPKE